MSETTRYGLQIPDECFRGGRLFITTTMPAIRNTDLSYLFSVVRMFGGTVMFVIFGNPCSWFFLTGA